MKIKSLSLSATILILISVVQISPASADAEPCFDVNQIETFETLDFICSGSEENGYYWQQTTSPIPQIEVAPGEQFADGFTFRITNFMADLDYEVNGGTADATLSSDGLVRVTGSFTLNGLIFITATKGDLFRVKELRGTLDIWKKLPLMRFAQPVQQVGRIDIKILNYTQEYDWEIESSIGDAVIDNFGVISVFRTNGSLDFALTISATYLDYPQSKVIYQIGKPLVILLPAPEPILQLPPVQFSEVHSQSISTYSFTITNYDLETSYSLQSTKGIAALGQSGAVQVSGLQPNETSTVTVTNSRAGWESSTGTITGSSFVAFDRITLTQFNLLLANSPTLVNSAYSIYGKISQINTATGVIIATVLPAKIKNSKNIKVNYVAFSLSPELLKNFLVRDFFTAKVVQGEYKSLKVAKNFTKRVPVLQVYQIERF